MEKKFIKNTLLIFLAVLLSLPMGGFPSQAEEAPALSLANLAIPETLGKVESRVPGKSERWVVHIQDVHAHFTAQENIAAIVEHLNAIYGVDTVALEGGTGETTFKESWGLPASREKHMLARALLERDYLTGPGHAALFSKTPLHLIGIEEEVLYEKNRALFRKHLDGRTNMDTHIHQMSRDLHQKKVALFSNLLLDFDSALGEYREGKNAEKFIPRLVKQCKESDVTLADLDQILLFMEMQQIEGSIKKNKLEAEAARLLKEFKKTGLHFEELLRSGHISEEKLEFYPATAAYWNLLKLQDKIHIRHFFEQIETAIARMVDKLYVTPEEKELAAKSERVRLAKKILWLEATPSYLKALEPVAALLRAELAQYALEEVYDLALEFYRVAKSRDDIFFQKIMEDSRLQGNIAVVTGGFHTEGLSARLEAAGISYLVVSPDLAEEAPDHDLYVRRMLEDVPDSQTVAAKLKYLIDPAKFDRSIKEAILELKKSRNVFAAIEIVENASSSSGEPVLGLQARLIDFESFSTKDVGEQNKDLYGWLEKVETGNLPIVIVIRTSTLAELLNTPVGLALWEKAIAPNRFNTIAVIQDGDYLDATIGIRARVIRLPKTTQMARVIQKRFSKDFEKRTLAVIDTDFQDNRVLVLPVHPVSLILARLFIENGLRLNYQQEAFLQLLNDRLLAIFEHEEVLRQAA